MEEKKTFATQQQTQSWMETLVGKEMLFVTVPIVEGGGGA